MPKRSCSCSFASPRLTVHSFGIAGLTSRQPSAVETAVTSPTGNDRSGLGSTHGARVIDSTPPVSTMSASPVSIARAPTISDSRLEPQSLLTVTAGTLTGTPARRAAIRPTLRLSSPAPLALPHTMSPIAAGSRSGVRASADVTTAAPRSSVRTPESPPLNRPNGVRTAAYT